MKMLVSALVTVTFLALLGCERTAVSPQGQVAVVDLDEVARMLGKDKQILQLIEQRQVTLNEQVSSTQKSLIQQLNQKKAEFGELSDDESRQLTQLQTQANAILTNTRTQAQSDLTAYQQEVVDRFRAEAKPVALEIAAKKGCRVVLSKNDSVVFAFDQAVDLTSEVATSLRSKAATSPVPSTATKAEEPVVKQAASNPRTGSKG